MKRKWDVRWGAGWTGFSLLAFAPALGCEAQANDEYSGEPLLSLKGNVVVSADQADADLVPRLGFAQWELEEPALIMVDGEVTGEFPAKFRFDVTQPPPDEALNEPWHEAGYTSKYTEGYLVMRPANDHAPIPISFDVEYLDTQCNEDRSECTRVEQECDGDRCRERTVECTQHPCALREHWGDSELELTGARQSTTRCDRESCYAVESACDEAGNCGTDVYKCDFAQYGEFEEAWEGVMTTCTVQSESGDTSVFDMDDLETAVTDYNVVYVTDDNPDSYLGPLKRGYNLVHTLSLEQWLEAQRCTIETLEAAVAEYNLEHGTQIDPIGLEADRFYMDATRQCPSTEVLAQPLDEDITLELGPLQSRE